MYKKMKFHPLEREFEGWVMRELEDYYSSLGIEAMTHAVGYEASFAADEFVNLNEKIFALQFKRPQFDKTSGGIYWQIQTSSDQFSRVKKEPSIYYALPCFFSRDLSRVSLQHILFWRQEFTDGELLFSSVTHDHKVDRIYQAMMQQGTKPDEARAALFALSEKASISQASEKSLKPKKKIVEPSNPAKVGFQDAHAVRWGRFSEEIFDCSFGIRTDDPSALKRVKMIVDAAKEASDGKDVVTVVIGVKGKHDHIVFLDKKVQGVTKSKKHKSKSL